jgi:hypothetical protein
MVCAYARMHAHYVGDSITYMHTYNVYMLHTLLIIIINIIGHRAVCEGHY